MGDIRKEHRLFKINQCQYGMKGPKPSHVRRTVVLAGAQIGAQKYNSVPPAHNIIHIFVCLLVILK